MVSIDPQFSTGTESGLTDGAAPVAGSPWLDQMNLIDCSIVNGAELNDAPDDGETPPGNPTGHPWPFWYGVVATGEEVPLPDGAVCELTIFSGAAEVFRQLVVSGVEYRLPLGIKSDL